MAGFGKFDSDYSALKALAYSVGVTTPENGWDSSYSIMASMYEHLVGAPVEIGTPMTAMLTEIAEGAESGEIVISDGCINEIERLNNIISVKDKSIGDLQIQLDEAAANADLALYSQIGYTRENASHFFDAEKEALEYAKKIQDEWVWEDRIYGKFRNNKQLIYMPFVNTTGTRSLYETFMGCSSLKVFPLLDTSSVTSMFQAFADCSSLTSIPQLDTSKVTNMEGTFAGCSSLTTIPQLDTSKVTNMDQLFADCSSLTSIPQLDTSSVTDMYQTFAGCSSLTTIPQLDTSKVTNMEGVFSSCSSLTSIPQLDTSKVTNASRMFNSCTKLESLPLLDFSNVTGINSFFGFSNLTKLTDVGGFLGLKIDWTSYGLSYAPNLTVQSLLNVFNTIADVNESPRILTIGTTNLNKLTDAQKAIAINKGWTLK